MLIISAVNPRERPNSEWLRLLPGFKLSSFLTSFTVTTLEIHFLEATEDSKWADPASEIARGDKVDIKDILEFVPP